MGRLLPLRPEPSQFGRGCVKTIGAQFDLFILATYVRFRMTYSARVERYRSYGRARWSFYTASARSRRHMSQLGVPHSGRPSVPKLNSFTGRAAIIMSEQTVGGGEQSEQRSTVWRIRSY